jgi:hypothetical protein
LSQHRTALSGPVCIKIKKDHQLFASVHHGKRSHHPFTGQTLARIPAAL